MNALTRMPRTQLLVLVSILIVVAELFANVVQINEPDDSDGSVGGWIGLSVFGIAVTTLLLLVVVPRLRGDQRRAATLGFGVGAVLTCVLFWSALPFALAAAALSAAGPADVDATGEAPAPATAGVILAVLAIAAAFILCIIG